MSIVNDNKNFVLDLQKFPHMASDELETKIFYVIYYIYIIYIFYTKSK